MEPGGLHWAAGIRAERRSAHGVDRACRGIFHASTREPPSGRLPLAPDGISWDGTKDGMSGFRTGRDWNRLEARGT